MPYVPTCTKQLGDEDECLKTKNVPFYRPLPSLPNTYSILNELRPWNVAYVKTLMSLDAIDLQEWKNNKIILRVS